MKREHRVQSALRPVYPLVPRMVGFCGDHSVIGAGSVVTRDIPPRSLAAGVPARVVREL